MPTARGWACIVSAGAMLGTGAVLRVPELLEIGVALLVLVLVQLLRIRRSGRDLTATRSIRPPAGMAGSPVTVEVTVSCGRRLPTEERLDWLDPVPQALGGARRLELLPPPGEGPHGATGPRSAAGGYRLTPARRGRYVIGQGRLSTTDAFGLVEALRPAGEASTLVVLPRLEPLRGRMPVAAGSAGAGAASAASLAAGSEFFATREWQPGDDMRRIHWRSTARMAQVMVRQEELPQRDRATVVLDNRRASYAEGWEGAEAFERAVEATASLVHHFLREGFAVRLAMAAPGGDAAHELPAAHRRGAAHHRLLMAALATVGFGPATPAPAALPSIGPRDGGGLVVLVGGVPEADRGEQLCLLLQGRDALVVRTAPGVGTPPPSLSHRVLHVPPGQTLAAVWNGVREAPRT